MRTTIEKPLNTPGNDLSVSLDDQSIAFHEYTYFYPSCTAPGDYTPEKSTQTLLDNSPKYTFGTKTQLAKVQETPGKKSHPLDGTIFFPLLKQICVF